MTLGLEQVQGFADAFLVASVVLVAWTVAVTVLLFVAVATVARSAWARWRTRMASQPGAGLRRRPAPLAMCGYPLRPGRTWQHQPDDDLPQLDGYTVRQIHDDRRAATGESVEAGGQ